MLQKRLKSARAYILLRRVQVDSNARDFVYSVGSKAQLYVVYRKQLLVLNGYRVLGFGENFYEILLVETVKLDHNGETPLQFGYEVADAAYMKGSACDKQNIIRFYASVFGVDGASLYNTTDLATIVWREEDYDPDEIIYVVDKRQELHFVQVFRCARKTGLVKPETELSFLGFGTMNGKDGKPFKTREGGVMRLENLIADIDEEMYRKIVENRSVKDKDAKETAKIVGLSAIKYGDLSNQATKDYIFDVDRFTSFEGNTGPYILYTIVRIKSILNRYVQEGGDLSAGKILPAVNASEKNLMLQLTGFGATVENAFEEKAPHKICAYIYEVSNAFNSFYHETKILSEENEAQKASFIQLLKLTKKVLETCIDLLGFSAPDRM